MILLYKTLLVRPSLVLIMLPQEFSIEDKAVELSQLQ